MASRLALLLLVVASCAAILLAVALLHHSQLQGQQEPRLTAWRNWRPEDHAEQVAETAELQSKVQELQRSLQELQHLQNEMAGSAGPGQFRPAVQKSESCNRTAAADTAGAALQAALEDIPRNTTLFVSFSNAHYGEFLINWAAHLKLLGAAHVVIAFDSKTEALCKEHAISLMPYDTQLEAENLRNNGTKFRHLAGQKPRIVQRLFETYGFQTIVLTDTDTIWLRHPDDHIAAHPLADMLISTDCASPKAEIEVVKNVLKCGHIAGSTCCYTYNTGILVLRNRPATLELMAAWHKRLVTPDKEEAAKDALYLSEKYRIGDQVMLNEIMMRGGHQPIVPLEEDPAVSLCFHKKVRVHALPALLFANGYTHFLQRLPERYNVAPYVVHATFQRDENEGKKSRFREWGHWHADPPDYYSKGCFMSYRNEVRAFIDRTATGYKGGRMVPFHKHQLAASYQLAALQHALAIARALNRTLILPQMWCWCDQDADAAILDTCINKGTEMQLPFKCPADHIIVVSKLEVSGAQLRHASFLQRAEVPAAIKQSVSPVVLHPAGAALPKLTAAARFAGHVRAAMTDVQLREALRPLQGVRVLHWQNFDPGAFGGFVDKTDTAAFDKMYTALTYYQGWCCSGGYWVDRFEFVSWPYVAPLNLAAGSARGLLNGAWQLPVYRRPTWCEDLKPANLPFTRLTNHPCKYLGDPDYGPADSNRTITAVVAGSDGAGPFVTP